MPRRSFSSWVSRRQPDDGAPKDESAPQSAPTPEPESEPTLNPNLVEVLTEDDRFFAEVELGEERLSDLLNREGTIQAFRMDRATDGSTPQESIALSVDRILLAIAPEQDSDSARRLHRPRHWVEIQIGRHFVFGNVYIPAGATPGGYLLRVNPKFVALTEAQIHTAGEERRTDVVLVNLRQVERMREIDR